MASALRVGNLREFEDGFARALLAPDTEAPGEIADLVRQPGFAVYRNTVMKGCIDALQANFPTVARLVGEEWFRAAASVYVRSNLPRQPSLLEYGDRFPEFLDRFDPAREFPYLAEVARLDRFWTEAHCAPDAAPLEASRVAALCADELARTVLHPHPSARWTRSEQYPAYTIWRRNRGSNDAGDGEEIEWHAEGGLVVRPVDAVSSIALDAAGCTFLDACARGDTLTRAAAAALQSDPAANLSRLLSRLLGAGAFCGMTISERAEDA
jgi:hypothetical protein